METEENLAASSAEQLAQLMAAWAEPVESRKNLLQMRGGRHWWEAHIEAVNLMVDMEAQVEKRKDPRLQNSWKRIEPRLWRCIFATEYRMNETGINWVAFEEDTLVILDAIVSALTYGRWRIVETREFLELRDELEGLKSDIKDTNLSDEVREYVLHLLARVEEALAEVAVTGTADVRALADQLIGSVGRLFVFKDDGEESKNFRNRLKRLSDRLGGFLNSPLVVAIAGGVAGNFVGQITAG
ncbi:hypothetical protein [Arachnia rubra]|mgnify:FL=1|uniref:Uncharacterized protein n=1 Tax=Arachnia rubra TaxID=1547448 RepID=A0ABX7Y5H0_9ACTN|nr:hypothetical protein [Arachnia rubra]QUC08455.1 hypothetical protein J5A65_01505 [Arachnia rubra]